MAKLTQQLLLCAEHILNDFSIIFTLTVVGITFQQAAHI